MYERELNASFTMQEGTTISGNQYRYINTIPLLLNGQYRFNPGGIRDSWIGCRNTLVQNSNTNGFIRARSE